MSEEFEDLLSSNAQILGATEKPPCEARQFTAVPSGEPVAIESMPSPLWNRKAPNYERQQELPWHRTALEMAAKGYTCEEIAARIGCTSVTVQDILRQPQYQQTQVNLIRQAANEDHEVCELIKSNVKMAVKTLTAIANDDKARASDRISAARELLDRRYGKPNQPMNRGTDIDLNNLSDADLAKMIPAPTTTGTNG